MRRSLEGLKARIDRLAARIATGPEGCEVCGEDERRVRFLGEGLPADAPLSNECSSCGRSYELSYVTWLPAQPKPDAV